MTPLLAEPMPAEAGDVFGAEIGRAARYAELLCDLGTTAGLLGPREAPRVWSRHILNCAVVARLIPQASTVVDIGSGAGLPGIPIALARPDVSVLLVESLARRARFLKEAVSVLELDGRVRIAHSRAEELAGPVADVAVSRAVAELPKLVAWSCPLLSTGGRILAIRGRAAEDEARAWRKGHARSDAVVHQLRWSAVDEGATVVDVTCA